MLFLGATRDTIASKINAKSCCTSSCYRTPNPIRIGKGIELARALREKSRAKVKGTFKVMKDPFQVLEVGFCWRLEVLRDSIDSKSDFGPCVGEILKASNKASIFGGIHKFIIIRTRY